MLGLLGLRIFEATGANIADLGEEHGHPVLRVCCKGTKVVLVPLPPAVGRAIDRAVGARAALHYDQSLGEPLPDVIPFPPAPAKTTHRVR